MDATPTPPPTSTAPPRLIPSLAAGFNAVSNHLYLLLFPILLDLALWFGPQMRIRALMQPILANFNASLLRVAEGETRAMLTESATVWQTLIEQFNLVSALRSFPVGIPSLMAAQGAETNPFGAPLSFESPNFGAAVWLWLLFGLAGLTLGSFFFNAAARLVNAENLPRGLRVVIWQTLQTILLLIIIVMVIILVTMPVFLLVWLLTFISPALTQFALLLVSVFLVWLLLPMFFSPHGIFTYHLDALRSTLISYQFVRFFLPGAGLFVLTTLLISQGLDILWRTPTTDSWMLVIGIAGHAFISTALVVSSFVYYKSGIQWMQAILKQARKPAAPAA